MYKLLIALVSTTLLLVSCATQVVEHTDAGMRYANLLTMQEEDSFTVARVADPWHKGRTIATYVMVADSLPLPHSLPKGTVVRTPLKRAIITSSVHAALLLDLQATHCMAGVTDVDYIVSPSLKAFLHQHAEVQNMGSMLTPDVERFKASHTDGLLVSPFENDENGALRSVGFTLIACADYMETSPLARAEWMRFYGRLFGVAQRSDSLFAVVKEQYNDLKQKVAKHSGIHPTVFCDLKLGNAWYQPGGSSTMGQLITDAGGHYLWDDRKESGSLALDLESVYARAHDADIWLIKYGQAHDMTYQQMQQDCGQYAKFKAWKQRKVWGCNTFKIPYFEEVPFHPNWLLHDLIQLMGTAKVSPAPKSYYTPLR